MEDGLSPLMVGNSSRSDSESGGWWDSKPAWKKMWLGARVIASGVTLFLMATAFLAFRDATWIDGTGYATHLTNATGVLLNVTTSHALLVDRARLSPEVVAALQLHPRVRLPAEFACMSFESGATRVEEMELVLNDTRNPFASTTTSNSAWSAEDTIRWLAVCFGLHGLVVFGTIGGAEWANHKKDLAKKLSGGTGSGGCMHVLRWTVVPFLAVAFSSVYVTPLVVIDMQQPCATFAFPLSGFTGADLKSFPLLWLTTLIVAIPMAGLQWCQGKVVGGVVRGVLGGTDTDTSCKEWLLLMLGMVVLAQSGAGLWIWAYGSLAPMAVFALTTFLSFVHHFF